MSQQSKKISRRSAMKNYDTARKIFSAWGLPDDSADGKTEEEKLEMQEFLLSSYASSPPNISDLIGDGTCFELEDPFGLHSVNDSTKETSNPYVYSKHRDLAKGPQLKRLKPTVAGRTSKHRSEGRKSSLAKPAATATSTTASQQAIPAKPAIRIEPAIPAIPAEPAIPAIPAEPAIPAIPTKPIEVHVKLPSESHLPVIMQFSEPIQFTVSQVETSVDDNTQVEEKKLTEYEFTTDAMQFSPSSLL